MIRASLRVDGTEIAPSGLPYTDLAWTDRADGGNFEATWSTTIAYGQRPAPFFKGAKVEIYLGPVRRWYGFLTDIEWEDGSFTAGGMSQRSYDVGARNGSNVTSSVPDTVIDLSIANDGWPVTRPTSFSTTPVVAGDVTEQFNTVGSILDQSATNAGLRWGIWGNGVIRQYAAPTVYNYILGPGVLELGETTEDTFSAVQFVYLNLSSVRSYGGVGVPTGSHTLQDFTNLGPISAGTAVTIAQNLLSSGASSLGWTSGVEVSSSQLLTPGGNPAELAAVTAGEMVRAVVIGPQGQGYRDLVIGETKYTSGSDVLSLSPVNKVATSLSDVIEDTYTRLTGQPVSA